LDFDEKLPLRLRTNLGLKNSGFECYGYLAFAKDPKPATNKLFFFAKISN